MRLGRLFWKLFLWNAVLMAAVLLTCIWLIVRQVDQFYVSELSRALHSQAETLRHMVADRFDAAHAPEMNRLALEMGRDDPAGIRITFIATDGSVLGDSESEPATMGSHSDRPEVRAALRDGWGEDTRFSHTLGRPMKYLAVRVGPPDSPAGVVRVAMGLRAIGEHADSVRRLVWSTGATGLVACVLLALGLARLWSQPIRRITRTARQLSRGDLSARVSVVGSDELAELARSLNEMRARLAAHLETIDGQRRTLESLLTQLQEGVVVTRPDGRIALINPSAARLLGIAEPVEHLVGRPVEGCITQHHLQNMLLERAEGDETAVHEVQIKVQGQSSRVSVMARVCDIALESNDGGATGKVSVGRLLVLTDVTPLAHMIQVKADFAANASHELRTPLSAIRAAVETLLSVDPQENAPAVRRFAEIIDRQSGRMDALVRDLLDLSRLESSPAHFDATTIELPPVFAELHDRYRDRFETKGLHWASDVAPSVGPVVLNPYLLRLILDNLVDNAVKFTDSGGHIRIEARIQKDEARCNLEISVTDDGCGISEDEQERVFERFYQVGRARSGAVRGTGLGLSIVRHAVSAMGGTAELSSKPGQGTTVKITVPASAEIPVQPARS
jgi:two-component system, OmpR family, phosphate regulon sensor histidine kinase PhoR